MTNTQGSSPLWSDERIIDAVYQLTYKVSSASALADARAMMYRIRDDYEVALAQLRQPPALPLTLPLPLLAAIVKQYIRGMEKGSYRSTPEHIAECKAVLAAIETAVQRPQEETP